MGFDGDFFVRDVDSRPGDVGMCLRTNRTGKHAIANFLIRKTSNGTFKLDATSKEFPSLRKLLHYYATEKRSALPVKLTMLEDGWDADSPATPRRRGSKGPEDYKSGVMDADQPPTEGAPWKRDPKKDLGRRDHLSAAARRHANEVQRQSIALDSDLQAVRMLSDNPDAAEAHLAVRGWSRMPGAHAAATHLQRLSLPRAFLQHPGARRRTTRALACLLTTDVHRSSVTRPRSQRRGSGPSRQRLPTCRRWINPVPWPKSGGYRAMQARRRKSWDSPTMSTWRSKRRQT